MSNMYFDGDEHAENDWPIFKDDPVGADLVRNWQLVAIMHDGKMYRVGVDAVTREDACREIVHHKMAEGHAVKRITDLDAMAGPGTEAF